MAIFKSLTFDGVNSLDYGIYITGEAVYNAPERAVELVNIAGKNGALVLDQGRFENIEVTYHAGCFADNQEDFARKVMEFRNVLASRFHYVRLSDEYHSDEYRMALYKDGLEVDAVQYSTAGEFDITFNAKPQRFLTSGEVPVTADDWSDVQTESGSLVTIDNDGSLAVKSLEVALEPIQSGSGTPSPDNVRPISGRTEVVTQRTGVNVWDEEWEVGGINANGEPIVGTTAIRSKNFIKVEPNAEYYFHTSANGRNNPFFYDENKNFVQRYGSYITNSQITVPSDCHYMKFGMTSAYGATYNNDISINYPSTDTDYHAYQGTTYTTALGRTVYGGTLDVVSGELTVDRAMVTLDGDEDWSLYAPPNYDETYWMQISDKMKQILTSISSAYENADAVWESAGVGKYGVFSDHPTLPRLYFRPPNSSITSLGEWKTWLASNPLQVVYTLATPTTYQLTPQEVELLTGTNNVWSDGGDVTLEYGTSPWYNPTPFDAKPLIKVTGTGTVQINDVTIAISESPTTIDCEAMEAYNGTESRNGDIVLTPNEFPTLHEGMNEVEAGSGITALEITPRWWRV